MEKNWTNENPEENMRDRVVRQEKERKLKMEVLKLVKSG